MRRVDAPAAGWYPDPENRTRLRWWDGLDWTDIRRAVPSDAEIASAAARFSGGQPPPPDPASAINMPYAMQPGFSRADAQDLLTEVRKAARAEVDRAADQFSQRTQDAIRSVTPLVTDYTTRLVRWVKLVAIVVTVLLIGWFIFSTLAEASFLDWIGERIDNLTNDDSGSGSGADLVERVDGQSGADDGPVVTLIQRLND